MIYRICRYGLVLLALAALAGCAAGGVKTTAGRKGPGGVRETLALEFLRINPGAAGRFMRQGQYPQAAVEFRKIISFAQEPAARERARLDLARCYIRMENYAGAVAALQPLSAGPQSDYERLKLALAGEALLRDGRTGDAETLLEIALDGAAPAEGADRREAVCSENLGCAYLKNGKPEKAAALYRRAALLYERQGHAAAARAAAGMAAALQAACAKQERSPEAP